MPNATVKTNKRKRLITQSREDSEPDCSADSQHCTP